jgi:hypothetical protein
VTLLRWHRELVAKKWTFLERRRPGRPRTKPDIEQLIVRMANENPGWGYTRIQGALMNLDIKLGRGTIRRILKDHLIEPAPARGRRISWSTFLKAHSFCAGEGVEVTRLPPRSPNLNAYAERFVRSIKEECVSKLIPIGTAMLHRSLREYVDHYHLERNHQGLDNQLLVPRLTPRSKTSHIDRRSRLGGMLNFYERVAA